jgi:hypothetical protein
VYVDRKTPMVISIILNLGLMFQTSVHTMVGNRGFSSCDITCRYAQKKTNHVYMDANIARVHLCTFVGDACMCTGGPHTISKWMLDIYILHLTTL